jgi:hypothetical protein
MNTKFKVIINDGDVETGINSQTIDCEHLDEAIREYRKALETHDQSQITLARVMP